MSLRKHLLNWAAAQPIAIQMGTNQVPVDVNGGCYNSGWVDGVLESAQGGVRIYSGLVVETKRAGVSA